MFIFLGPDTDTYLLLLGFYAAIITYAILKWYRNKGKIRVRIMSPIGERIDFYKPESDGKTIIVEKNQGRRLGWKFTFDRTALYFYPRSFFRIIPLPKGLGLDVVYDAKQAVSYDYNASSTSMYPLTKDDIKEITDAQVIKNWGKGPKEESPRLMLVVVAMLGVVVVLVLLMAQRIGIF